MKAASLLMRMRKEEELMEESLLEEVEVVHE
jgi:hypothetical protein